MSQERANVIVPQVGLRDDVNPLMATPDMMVEGVNVIVYDGALRPRPGLSRQEFGIQANAWIIVNEEAYISSAVMYSCLLLYTEADTWMMSDDDGASWVDVTIGVSGISTVPTRMLWAKAGSANYLFAWGADGYLYRAVATDFPTIPSLTFTQLGQWTTDPTNNYMTQDDAAYFSATSPYALFWKNAHHGLNETYVYSLEDAPTTVNWASDHHKAGGLLSYELVGAGAGYCLLRSTVPVTINGKWYYYYPSMSADFLTYISWAIKTKAPTTEELVNEKAPPPIPSIETGGIYRDCMITSTSPLTFIGVRDNSIQQVVRTGNLTATFSLKGPNRPSALYQSWALSNPDQACAVGVANWRCGDWDLNNTWKDYEDFPGDYREIMRLYALGTGSGGIYFLEVNNDGVYELWFVKGNLNASFGVAGDPELGNTLTLFQASLDTDPYALFMGNTKSILKLNRGTDDWEDVSPDKTDWEIDGVENSNRWVFRAMDKGGDRYVLATNGQQVPLVYPAPPATPGDPDRFRPMGDEDEDQEIDEETETAAPIAHCMAIANNRLVLGNLSGDTPSSVRISDSHNFDTGYSIEYQLDDTPGAIVAMREMSAITIAILKEDAIYHGISQTEFMGVSAPMRFEMVRAGIAGPCSDAAVVYLPDGRLCWLGRDGGVYIYDGATPVDAGRHIRHLIGKRLNEENYGWVHGCVDPKRNLLYFYFPTAELDDGEVLMNWGIVASIDQGSNWPVWLVRYEADWQFMSMLSVFFWTDKTYKDLYMETYGGSYSQFPYGAFQGGKYEMVMARRNNSVYTQLWNEDPSFGYSDNGTPIKCAMRTGWYDFDDLYAMDTFHTLDHNVRFSVLGEQDLRWTLLSEQPDGTEKEQTSILRRGMPRLRTQYRQTGRRHAFRIDADTSYYWEWAGATGSFSRRGGR